MKINKSIWLIAGLLITVIFVSGCVSESQNKENAQTTIDKPKQAELTAQAFARAMQQSDYETIWDMLTPELRAGGNKEAFARQMKIDFEGYSLFYEKVETTEDSNKTYAYYTANSGLYESKAPGLKMIYVDGKWYFDAFAGMVVEKTQKEITLIGNTVEKDYWGNTYGFSAVGMSGADLIINSKRTFVGNCDDGKIHYYSTTGDYCTYAGDVKIYLKDFDSVSAKILVIKR